MANLFGKSEEIVNSKFLSAGIHDFKIKGFYYQPSGPSVKGKTKKDGSIVEFKKNQIIIEADVLTTHAGGDSVGAEASISLNVPELKNDGKDNKRFDRVFHILCNIASSDKKDKFKEVLMKANFKGETLEENFEDMAKVLAPMVTGKSVRYKLVATDGKGAYLPSYFGGFAECADVPFEKTTLTFDVEKEGNKKQSNIESGLPVFPELAGGVTLPSEFNFDDLATKSEGLPFDL